jgi:hypothetical protein
MRHPGLAVLETRIALGQKPRQGIDGGRHAGARGEIAQLLGHVRSVVGSFQAELLGQSRVDIGDVPMDEGFLRPLGETLGRLPLPVDRGIEEIGQIGIQRLELRLGRLPGGKLGLLG